MSSFADPHFNADADEAVGTIRAAAGILCLLEARNPNVADAYLQLFDDAAPVVGTTTPKLSFYIPGSGGMDKMFTVPISFVNAIKYAVTTTPTGAIGPVAGVTLNAASSG